LNKAFGMSFLVIDIGNTRLKWAQYSAATPGANLISHGAVFLETIDCLADNEWRGLAAPQGMLGCVVAGEGVKRRVEEQLEMWNFEPRWVVASAQACGVINSYEHPNRLGVDRWVALIAARHRMLSQSHEHAQPRPVLVVMVGTAVTVDAMDASGRFLGGLILPGFGLMLRALEMGTAGLKAPTGDATAFPTNTSDALMSGGADAIVGAVERMHRRLSAHTGVAPALILTGGAAVKLASISDLPFETVDTLIFEGLLQMSYVKRA
jgi:type III pantothenate kinase